MAGNDDDALIVPGQALGFMNLGASLQNILSFIQKDVKGYPAIDVHYSQSEPFGSPIVVNLPRNGLRLRFDAVEQRLRLIEVLDFVKMKMTYKGSELVRQRDDGMIKGGPAFRRIYQIFGASFPGEYIRPRDGSDKGTYILSWSGIAFTFPLLDSSWSPDKDHVSLLGSYAASSASNMAIFEGKNWTEASKTLFTMQPTGPRSIYQANRSKDPFPGEIEMVKVSSGHIELLRRQPAQRIRIRLNETSPEDLIAEIGPPNTTHRREAKPSDDSSHKRTGITSKGGVNGRTTSQPSSYSSTATDTYEVEFDAKDEDEDPVERANRDTFWCYFDHGMDILVGATTTPAPCARHFSNVNHSLATSSDLVVTKLVLHGNIPGSYAFNRHRRVRWTLDLPGIAEITSEMHFDSIIKPRLLQAFSGVWPGSEMARGKVVNRTWSAGPNDSSFFLPDAGEDLIEGVGSEQWLGNTKLYHFPGLTFEVMENGTVIAVSIS